MDGDTVVPGEVDEAGGVVGRWVVKDRIKLEKLRLKLEKLGDVGAV